jgi:hypothetical protein
MVVAADMAADMAVIVAADMAVIVAAIMAVGVAAAIMAAMGIGEIIIGVADMEVGDTHPMVTIPTQDILLTLLILITMIPIQVRTITIPAPLIIIMIQEAILTNCFSGRDILSLPLLL